MTIGIYCLQFEGTDKVYIGQSINIERRYIQHKYAMVNLCTKYKLQQAYKLYGFPSLLILTECNKDELDQLEIEAINLYNSVYNGFNSTFGSSTGTIYSNTISTRSKYTESQILEVLNLLIEDKLTATNISILTGVSTSTIGNISAGDRHTWLKEQCPDQYAKLLSIKGNRSTERRGNKKYKRIKDPSGNIYEVSSIKEFSKVHNLLPSNLGKLLRGQALSHKGWTTV